MTELLKANVLAHLAYYRRSRLLLAFMLLFLLITGLQSLPAVFTHSGVQSLNTLQDIFSTLNFFSLVFAGGLGLFIVSSHLRSRSLKMVFTKPCSPALWLASAFIAAGLATLLITSIVLCSAILLSLIWQVPVRAGLLFISLDTFASSLGLIAYLILLATVAHPAIAVIFVLIFNAALFYDGQVWALGTIRAGDSSWSLRALERVFHYIYFVLPMIHPFGQKTEGIYASLRVMHGEWKYLLYSMGYALTLATFCYFLALVALQRKKHI